jgi:hypothetical protein
MNSRTQSLKIWLFLPSDLLLTDSLVTDLLITNSLITDSCCHLPSDSLITELLITGFKRADLSLWRICLLGGCWRSLFKDPAKLAGCALGGLQRIDFLGFLGRPRFCHMGGHAAFPGSPFDGWFGENKAVFAGGKFFDFLAPDALFNDLVAGASVELTSVLAHEETLDTLFYVCANHGYHILSPRIVMIKKNRLLCRRT